MKWALQVHKTHDNHIFSISSLECGCNLNNSITQLCEAISGNCTCKENYIGSKCTECVPGFFGYPDCKGNNHILKMV